MKITKQQPLYTYAPSNLSFADELVEICRDGIQHGSLESNANRHSFVAQYIDIFRAYFDKNYSISDNTIDFITPDYVISSYDNNEAAVTHTLCQIIWDLFHKDIMCGYDIHEKFEKPPYSLYEYEVLPYEIESGIKNIADFSTEMLESLCREYSITEVSEEIDDSLASHYEECKKNRGKGIVTIYNELNNRISN